MLRSATDNCTIDEGVGGLGHIQTILWFDSEMFLVEDRGAGARLSWASEAHNEVIETGLNHDDIMSALFRRFGGSQPPGTGGRSRTRSPMIHWQVTVSESTKYKRIEVFQGQVHAPGSRLS